jgi:signal transduction histidine kinase
MNTFDMQQLRTSWRAWLGGDAEQVGPWWMNLVWTAVFSALVAVPFTVLGFAAYADGPGAWRNVAGWWHWYQVNLVVSLCIGMSIGALFMLGRRWVGAARLRALPAPLRTLYFVGLPLVGTAIGWPLGAALTSYRQIKWQALQDPNNLAATVLMGLIVSSIFSLLFGAKARQLQAEKRAAEAQLRLLQGQIEPHFLFNTLANVLSLIDHDAPRAKQMLESFTDYLRSSLTSLRHEEASLGNELDLAQAYLGLLQTRMEDRLQFSITGDPALRAAQLPPLLLQPLVENAIHHGLEPKVEGGHLRVSARAEGRALVLEVADDGLGLGGPVRRRGAGMALANLRERLLAKYGSQASLSLADAKPGTIATLRLPLQMLTPSVNP